MDGPHKSAPAFKEKTGALLPYAQPCAGRRSTARGYSPTSTRLMRSTGLNLVNSGTYS